MKEHLQKTIHSTSLDLEGAFFENNKLLHKFESVDSIFPQAEPIYLTNGDKFIENGDKTALSLISLRQNSLQH